MVIAIALVSGARGSALKDGAWISEKSGRTEYAPPGGHCLMWCYMAHDNDLAVPPFPIAASLPDPQAGKRELFMKLPLSMQMAQRQMDIFRALRNEPGPMNYKARALLVEIEIDCGRWADGVELLERAYDAVEIVPEPRWSWRWPFWGSR